MKPLPMSRCSIPNHQPQKVRKSIKKNRKENEPLWPTAVNSPPARSSRSMDSAAAVVAILGKLQSLGFCADLWIPDDVVACDPSKAFEAVLATFLPEAYPGSCVARRLLATVGGGRRVDLLRLFLAVRSAGGYAALSSAPIDGGWAAAAESAGMDASLAAPVKLIYAKYLGALDRWIQRLVEKQGPFLDDVGWKRKILSNGSNIVEK